MRLDQYLAQACGESRAAVRKYIMKGLVTVEDVVCRKADTQVDAASAAIALRDVRLVHTQYVYIMLDKPEGVVSAASDARDTTVTQLVQADYPRRSLFPAGRLDKTSTGFVLLTDDGVFAHDILAPKRHVSKTYEVLLDTPLTQEMCDGFAQGVTLVDGTQLQPATLRPGHGDAYTAEVVLTQGVYHQIKRMFGVYDAGVNALRRTALGPIPLDPTLGPGGFRDLTSAEVAALRAAVGKGK